MYENNVKLCSALGGIFTHEFCNTVFRMRPHKVWRLWERQAGQDMSKFLASLPADNRKEFYTWINERILTEVFQLYQPIIDDSDVGYQDRVQAVFTRDFCDNLYYDLSDQVWKAWLAHDCDMRKFMPSANGLHKYILLAATAHLVDPGPTDLTEAVPEPVDLEPAEPEPVDLEPAEPVDLEPAEPVDLEPAEPAEPEPAEPEPAEPEPVDSEQLLDLRQVLERICEKHYQRMIDELHDAIQGLQQ